MIEFVHKNVRRLYFASSGILSALKTDSSFKMQFYLGFVFIICFLYLTWPLTQTEGLFLALSWILVLITELQNTAFEAALDQIHPELYENIGRSKDMAAGAVFIAALFALTVVCIIILNRIS